MEPRQRKNETNNFKIFRKIVVYVKKFSYVCSMKKEKILYVILKQRNIKIKVKEVLEDGRYKLIDGDIVSDKEILEIIKE